MNERSNEEAEKSNSCQLNHMTRREVLNVPEEDLPLMVFSDNVRSWVAARIKSLTEGWYNHFMWMVEPGQFVTQNSMLCSVPVSEYLDTHRLKLWSNPDWNEDEKFLLRMKVKYDLRKP